MIYYYGNSMKEALSNHPIEIRTTKELQQYQKIYSCIIPEIRGDGKEEEENENE